MSNSLASPPKSFDERFFVVVGFGILILNTIPEGLFDPIFAEAWRKIFPGPTLFTLAGIISVVAAYAGFKSGYFSRHRKATQFFWSVLMLIGLLTNGYVFWTAVAVLTDLKSPAQFEMPPP
ncbi:MAG: hypothetical protein Q7T36_16530 [Fluviicoccus sp.]|uniref:hypothetical protein n=1 Tax=Fluviicoccus sp. TaxID=2003552 RepID=UPI00271CC681|nr:hypothetical protein [Fluviicoccus sp.]MDO8332072.1 hypothetical protein [Fluviicoccus sp.]